VPRISATFFKLIAQHFVDVRHVIKVVAAIVVHPFHDLIGTKWLLAHLFKELAHLLTVQVQQVNFPFLLGTAGMATSEVFTNSDIIFSGLVVTRCGPWWVEKKRPGKQSARPGRCIVQSLAQGCHVCTRHLRNY